MISTLERAGQGVSPQSSGSETLVAARRVLRLEAEAISAISERLDHTFVVAVETILACTGRVIVSGVGKSGIIARKIAATLTSTGTQATFLHPVEALHGDLGMVGARDVALLVSKSGETEELHGLMDFFARTGVPIIAMIGRAGSTLARHARVVLDCRVVEEACPYDLAPTSSTTAALAVGDALAVALLERRGFAREDFARIHPAGALGKRLVLRVADVMVTGDLPKLPVETSMRECVVVLAEQRGTALIVDETERLAGVVTAGDLTRLMEREEAFFTVPVSEVMTRNPLTVRANELAATAAGVMERGGVMALPVLDPDDRVLGIVHLHDLMRAGAL